MASIRKHAWGLLDRTISRTASATPEKVGREDDLIFDIGMDTGEDTSYYLAKGFRVVAVEANPAVCAEAAKRHDAAISQGRLTIVNRAISRNNEPLAFFICETNSAWSTTSPRLRDYWESTAGAAFKEIRVEGCDPSAHARNA